MDSIAKHSLLICIDASLTRTLFRSEQPILKFLVRLYAQLCLVSVLCVNILDIVCRVVFLFLNDVFVGMALLKSDDLERGYSSTA